MRVLDLGCGRAMSSVFLHREFGVQVWATDLWFSASENLQRIRDAGVEDGVFPIHADARSLPFAAGFFDAIVSIDSFFYYGTDELYLNYLARFVKPGGRIGIAGAGLMREMDVIPVHLLREWWTADMACLHSAAWWARHWGRTGILDIEVTDTLPDGWRLWRGLAATGGPRQRYGDPGTGIRRRQPPRLRSSGGPSQSRSSTVGAARVGAYALRNKTSAPRLVLWPGRPAVRGR